MKLTNDSIDLYLPYENLKKYRPFSRITLRVYAFFIMFSNLFTPKNVIKTKRTTLLNKNVNANQWVDKIINTFQITKNSEKTNLIVKLKLNNTNYHFYNLLQKKIATLIPTEANRPTIDLKIIGEKAPVQKKFFGIVGGVGPLSDAAILDLTIKKLYAETVKIHLYSSPPPRQQNFITLLKNLWNYCINLKKFLRKTSINRYSIASNTAHLNFNFLQRLARNRIFNLVNQVVENISASKTKNTRILILGTFQGRKKFLYEKLFKKNKIKSFSLPLKTALSVQKIIDNVKANKNDLQNSVRLVNLIKKKVIQAQKQDKSITHILLGCTELPLCLEFFGKDFQKKLEAEIGVKIINTEKTFAKIIANQISKS